MNPTRRRLLRDLALAPAVLALPGLSRSLAAPVRKSPKGFEGFSKVELAIATICTDGFGNHHHEPAFRVIPDLGFRNVEFNLWYPDTITPSYLRSIAERCEKAHLRPVSLQGSSFGGEGHGGVIKDVAHKLLLMQEARKLGCHLVKFTGARRGTGGGLEHVKKVCRELAPAAEELGVLVTLENHANNVLERPEDYDEIFSAIDSPNIGMCLDTGHFEGVSVDLLDVIDRFHERVLHVDLKDCKARGKGHDTVPFGEGVTDFDAFLTRLLEKDYRGYLVVEQAWREPRGDWMRDLKRAHEKFRRWERA